MDMSSMTSTMADMVSSTVSAAATTATAAMSHGSHGSHGAESMSGMDMGSDSCEMHMLGNWQTIGSCFLTSSWRISTQAQFAGTCIGVGLLVMLIESIRRWGREYDRWLVASALAASSPKRHRRAPEVSAAGASQPRSPSEEKSSAASSSHASATGVELESGLAGQNDGDDVSPHVLRSRVVGSGSSAKLTPRAPRGAQTLHRLEQTFFGLPKGSAGARALSAHHGGDVRMFRPTAVQQGVRSLVYALQFTGAYIIMLIAMSFNGYILLSIILGALIGHFFSTWDTISFPLPPQTSDDDDDENEARCCAAPSARAVERGNLEREQLVANSAAASEDPYLLMTGGGGASTIAPATHPQPATGTKAYGGTSGTCCD